MHAQIRKHKTTDGPPVPLLLITTVLLMSSLARGDDAFTSPRTAWYRQATFGIFIHWGLYSVAGGEWNGRPGGKLGEWILSDARIPNSEYETLSRHFHPAHFNAKEWTTIAKDAGMTYLVVTSKHHDGFCMWPTRVTPYNVFDATPFHRDPLAELKSACDESGIRFCIYYSIMDWHHPELSGYWHAQAGAATKPDDPRVTIYIETQMKPQLRELIERYHPAILWFDG